MSFMESVTFWSVFAEAVMHTIQKYWFHAAILALAIFFVSKIEFDEVGSVVLPFVKKTLWFLMVLLVVASVGSCVGNSLPNSQPI